ncbi:DUF6366 family protein [Bacillus sp. FJAT-26390]|uniref:DUF6366 family protein n=1 Tax=Bacillus sp. FJAT-26390 TaxID=1743142 RepID=UPI0009E1C86D|nr:DUF6366 family protein [Bacillus sp. FJAT-26390]
MDSRKETPEEKRERLRLEELKNNPSGAFNDGANRAEFGSLADLVGGLGWKGTPPLHAGSLHLFITQIHILIHFIVIFQHQ